MPSHEPAISVSNLNKTFRLPHEQYSGAKHLFVNFFNRKRGYEVQKVLENVSFEIKKGDFFGIVGRNGSGKSTLLKLLAGIYTPDSGQIKINGSLTPFIELGVGFNPELTGRENVFMNGALLGFSRQEMDKVYNEIVEFAELNKFMDQKLKNYSSGMQVRLAFSIAIRAKSEILLLDEVLAVGDEAFQRKCTEYFAQIKRSGQTVALVTHSMDNIERFCTRALVLDNGRVLKIDKPAVAKKLYEQLNSPVTTGVDQAEEGQSNTTNTRQHRWGTGEVRVVKVLLNNGGINQAPLETGQQFKLSIKLESIKPVPVVVGIAIEDSGGTNISGPNSARHRFLSDQLIEYKVDHLPCNPGRYYIRVAIFDESVVTEFDHIEQVLCFDVITGGKMQSYGKIELFGQWDAH